MHHATVHYVSTATGGNLARWHGGKQSICPKTAGLEPGYNAFVTARIRAVAAKVGAPVQSNLQCEDNVKILFTSHPQEAMKDVVKWATDVYLSVSDMRRDEGRGDKSDQVVQGWYITTRGGARVSTLTWNC